MGSSRPRRSFRTRRRFRFRRDADPRLVPDGVHFSEEGYKQWALALAPVFHRLLRESRAEEPGSRDVALI